MAYRESARGTKMEEIEMPRGFIRTWKAWLLVVVGCVTSSIAASFMGHQMARVETKEVRVEIPPSERCGDIMILVNEDTKEIRCPHPEHRGHFEDNHTVGGCNIPRTYLMCSCPTPQISLEAGAR